MMKKDFANIATTRQQRKTYLKIGIAALITAAVCGWATYGLFNPRVTMRYNDFVIDTAVNWLESADRQDFDACRKNAADSDGWFDWFVTDRKSLGNVKSRSLAVRQELADATDGMKHYELQFDSQFSKLSSRGHVSEQMIVETDGRSQFKVVAADYWFPHGFEFSALTVTEDEKSSIMAVAEDVLKKIDAGNIVFFKQIYTELAQQPDYFRRNNRLPVEAKTKVVVNLCGILAKDKLSQREFTKLETTVPLGRSGLECSVVSYKFTARVNEKSQNYILRIFINRDLYQNKSAGWKFNALRFRREKQ